MLSPLAVAVAVAVVRSVYVCTCAWFSFPARHAITDVSSHLTYRRDSGTQSAHLSNGFSQLLSVEIAIICFEIIVHVI